MEKVGATNLNGTTNNDRTNYFENVPTSDAGLRALSPKVDRMGHLLGVLDQKKLDLQRGVVQNEKRQGENQPYGVTEQLHHGEYVSGRPSLFLDRDWLHEGSGRGVDERRAGVVQNLLRPEQRHAGDCGRHRRRSTREEKVEKYYGEIPAGPPIAKQEVWIAKTRGTHRGSVQDRVPQARLYRVWNVPEFGSPEEATAGSGGGVLAAGQDFAPV